MPKIRLSTFDASAADVSAILEEKFPDLTVQDSLRLSNKIVRAVIRRVEQEPPNASDE